MKHRTIKGLTVGVRLNNPLNIKRSEKPWKGEDTFDPHPTFVTFDELKWGYRAALVTLYNYFHLHGCNTIRKIISRWAPPTENPTEDYIEFVSKYSGTPADGEISFSEAHKICEIVEAMAHFESNSIGQMALIRQAYEMVCIEKNVSPSYLDGQ